MSNTSYVDLFSELPFELKLYTIELSPGSLIPLLVLDKDIRDYFNSAQGQNWFNRTLVRIYDTPEAKGLMIGNDVKHGQWEYYKNGRLMKIKNYFLGRLEGVKIKYYGTTGTIYSKEYYVHGLKEGDSITYYRSGNIQSVKHYVRGKRDERIEYSDTL